MAVKNIDFIFEKPVEINIINQLIKKVIIIQVLILLLFLSIGIVGIIIDYSIRIVIVLIVITIVISLFTVLCVYVSLFENPNKMIINRNEIVLEYRNKNEIIQNVCKIEYIDNKIWFMQCFLDFGFEKNLIAYYTDEGKEKSIMIGYIKKKDFELIKEASKL